MGPFFGSTNGPIPLNRVGAIAGATKISYSGCRKPWKLHSFGGPSLQRKAFIKPSLNKPTNTHRTTVLQKKEALVGDAMIGVRAKRSQPKRNSYERRCPTVQLSKFCIYTYIHMYIHIYLYSFIHSYIHIYIYTHT